MKHPFFTGGILLALISITGCASSGPNLPPYVEPTLPKAQAVTVESYAEAFITVVDTYKVGGLQLTMEGMGGNSVTLTPGMHHLTIYRAKGTRAMLTWGHAQDTWGLDYHFEPGHAYEVGPKNRFNPFSNDMVMRDKTDGTTVPF